MRIFVAVLALILLIAIPSFTQTANAAPVSPASSAFGGNGY
jgi:Tfp pilus assembly protein FimT